MRHSTLLLAVIGFTIATGCRSKTDTPASGINKGKETGLISTTVSPEANEIRVDKPGDVLNGLTIEVPANTFSGEGQLSVSSSDIVSHKLGPYFTPLTPLIKIVCEAGEANQLLSINIPVKVPAGKFAMAFQYNDRTGEVDGLPFTGEAEPGMISVALRTVSGNSKIRSEGLASFGGNSPDLPYDEIVVACVDTAFLDKTILSDFRAGVDDWRFPNYGSHAAPKGHCSGQSIGMMWYYFNKKRNGSPALYDRFDNDGNQPATPTLWYDDALAYKFCSVLQKDWSFSDENKKLSKWQYNNDTRSYQAFAYSILLTGQPQLAIIFPSGDNFSHAIVVYGVRNDSLLIVDPNKPGNGSLGIQYRRDDKVFQPYFTGQNAGDDAAQYHYIVYYSKSVLKSWTTAAAHWQELASKTIGDNLFPSFAISALNEQDEFVSLENGFTLPPGGRLTLNIRCDIPVKWYCIDENNSTMSKEDENAVLLHKEGTQRIGICLTDMNNSWMGFKWFTVNNPSPALAETPTGSGRLTVELTVDGVPVKTDSAKFVIHDIDGLTLNTWGERFTSGEYAYTYTLDLKVHEVRSERVYQLTGESGTMFWQYSSFYINPQKPGSLTIEKWNGTSLSGTFQFEADDGYGRVKKVEGRFYR